MKPNEQLIVVLHNLFAVQSPDLNKGKVIRAMLQGRGRIAAGSAEQMFQRLEACRIFEHGSRRRLVINKKKIQQWFDAHCLEPILFRIGF